MLFVVVHVVSEKKVVMSFSAWREESIRKKNMTMYGRDNKTYETLARIRQI